MTLYENITIGRPGRAPWSTAGPRHSVHVEVRIDYGSQSEGGRQRKIRKITKFIENLKKSIFLKVVPTSIPDLLPRPARSRGGCLECLGVAKVLQVRRAEASMSTCGRGGLQVTENPENHENLQNIKNMIFLKVIPPSIPDLPPHPARPRGGCFECLGVAKALQVCRAEASMFPCWGWGAR